jgi:hypothetical protein
LDGRGKTNKLGERAAGGVGEPKVAAGVDGDSIGLAKAGVEAEAC